LPGREKEGKWSFGVPSQTKEMKTLGCVEEWENDSDGENNE